MASKKVAVNSELEKAFSEAKPANPALSTSDKSYLRGLVRRGFTPAEIEAVAKKAGFLVPASIFIVKPKFVKKGAVVTPVGQQK